jgi:hypothetical protein
MSPDTVETTAKLYARSSLAFFMCLPLTMSVTCRVMFPTSFDWVKGGKLPGLCTGKCPTGCANPTPSDGFSCRIMWDEYVLDSVHLASAYGAPANCPVSILNQCYCGQHMPSLPSNACIVEMSSQLKAVCCVGSPAPQERLCVQPGQSNALYVRGKHARA